MDSEDLRNNELRKKAEEISRNKEYPIGNSSKDELIKELRTHQIELEIRNEELVESHLKLEDSRRKYWDLYDYAPIGYLTLDANSIIKEINLSGAELLEKHRKQLIGIPFTLFLTQKSKTLFIQHIKNVLKTGMDRYCDLEIVQNEGKYKDIHITTSLQKQDHEITFRIAIVDISKTKQAEELKHTLKRFSKVNRTLLALRHSSFSMMHAEDEISYLNDICKIIIDDCGYSMVWIGFAEENKKVRPVVHSGFVANYLKTLNITWDDTEHGKGPTGTAVRTGELDVCEDMQTDPKFKPWREEALKRGYHSSIGIPIINNEKVLGAITIYSEETNPFSREEKELLKELSDDVAYGITTIRLKTEKEKSDKKLEESQKNYQSLYTSMNEGVAIHEIIYDAEHKPVDYRLIDTNPIYEDILGLKRSDVIGKKASEIYGTDKPPYLEIYSQIAESGKSTEFETYFEPMDIYFSISVISPEKGKFYTIFEDITERKIAEKELRESEERYRTLFDSMLEGLAFCQMVYDDDNKPVDWIYLDVNSSFERLTGLKKTAGKKVTEILPDTQESNPELFEIYGRVALTGEPETFEIDFKPLNVWLNISVFSPKKEHFVAVFEDITERKKIELDLIELKNNLELLVKKRTDELEESYASLRKSEEHYQTLFNSIDEGFCTIEVIFDHDNNPIDYRFLEINPAFEAQTGLFNAQGKLMGDLAPDHEVNWFEIYGKIALTGKSMHFIKEAKALNRWYDIHAFKVKKEEREVAILFNDITEYKRVETELREYQNTLEEKVSKRTKELARSNAELEHFAYIASHDLREPLRMITSFLQLLERRYKDRLDHDANEFIEYAVDGAKRLNDMINDLLEYSKVTSKEPILVPVNLEKVLDDALINLVIRIEEKSAIIEHDPLPVRGDENLLTMLFQNIIGNSIKYNDKKPPKIHISSKKEDNQYIIGIKDNGIGIKPEHLDRIFTIFQRLHAKDEYEGTGIGLAISQKIVQQHHGEIWAESEYGKGTTFFFTLPIKTV